MNFEVSFIVVTYNAEWNQLTYTLDSLLSQKDISYEIIISDDGSKDNYADEINEYMKTKEFDNYQLVMNDSNRGTVYNLFSGLEFARGEYAKAIGPGDAFTGNDIIRNWIDYMKDKGCHWSFSDVIYYNYNEGKKMFIRGVNRPYMIKPYLKEKNNECIWNYIVLDDWANGASVFCETKILKEYCQRILGKVKYAEDNIWRILMFEGDVGGYFAHPTLFYEYGTGVSTNGNSVWMQRLKNDRYATDKIIFDRKDKSKVQEKMYKAEKRKKSKFLRLFNKKQISYLYYRFVDKRYSTLNAEYNDTN